MLYVLYFICYLIYIILHIMYPLYLHMSCHYTDIMTQCIIPDRLLQAIPKILYTYYLVIDVISNIKEKLH